ncbi:hypothetical protein [Rhodopirellula islandica]|uniref:hypothetical protein n=1 Tax=Rhodopirellula islandica TaxID=595434 RepID=UPI001F305AA9|nr:hypothetical protein [Rhodopirellula islandica]
MDHNAAQSLLGTLTAAWHPRLLSQVGRVPTWHRADDLPSPPTPLGSHSKSTESSPTADNSPSNEGATRLLLVPEASISKLTASVRDSLPQSDAEHRCVTIEQETHREIRIRCRSRQDALALIDSSIESNWFGDSSTLKKEPNTDWPNLSASLLDDIRLVTENGREIGPADFFALGYTWWQIQVLTRRLRYTSNLDQVYFETRVLDAAEAWTRNDAEATAAALHDCFDALAEERDHYFASDPSLIDLTLLTPSTLDRFFDQPEPTTSTTEAILATPRNALVDQAVAEAVLNADATVQQKFQSRFAAEAMSWAGGGPAPSICFDELTIDEMERTLRESIDQAERAIGQPMVVHARLGGSTTPEVVAALASHKHDGQSQTQCRGLLPIDFLNGTGFGDEAKVILGENGHEIEALTAKPLDANNESSFLTLGTRLGEAIDAGEIATALLVHWPGEGCDSFNDLNRAATWTLALGRFWKIDEYFIDGENPYHHGSSASWKASPADRMQAGAKAARQSATGYASLVQQQSSRDASGLSMLANPRRTDPTHGLAESLGLTGCTEAPADLTSNPQPTDNVLVINHSGVPTRQRVLVKGKLPTNNRSVFHAHAVRNHTDAVLDIPAWGYRWTSSNPAAKPLLAEPAVQTGVPAAGGDHPRLIRWAKQLGRSMSRGPGAIVDGERMSNEFLELNLNPEHGGIQGVYSGKVRGNRLSTRIEFVPAKRKSADKNASGLVAKCDSVQTKENSVSRGVVAMAGTIALPTASSGDASDSATGQQLQWQSEIELVRGSRLVRYRIRFEALPRTSNAEKNANAPLDWIHHPVLRMAFPGASPVVRAIVREKLHRTSARRFLAPLGFVHEEDECQTLVATHGNSFHRRSEDRFLETLLPLAEAAPPTNEATDGFSPWHEFAFGFDVPHPIDASMQPWRTPTVLQVPDGQLIRNGVPAGSWLMHASPSTMRVQIVATGKLDDGRMVLHLRAIQTTSKSVRGVVRFCQPVALAHPISPLSRPLGNHNEDVSAPPKTVAMQAIDKASIDGEVKCEDDRIEWASSGHGVTHLCVVFDTNK